jgi:hypothetical protein
LKKNHVYLLVKKDTSKKKACIVVDDYDKMSQLKEKNKAIRKRLIS